MDKNTYKISTYHFAILAATALIKPKQTNVKLPGKLRESIKRLSYYSGYYDKIQFEPKSRALRLG